MKEFPYNAWVTMPLGRNALLPGALSKDDCQDCFYIKTCLQTCNDTKTASVMLDRYPSTDFGYFCIPDPTQMVDGSVQVTFSFSGDFSTMQQNAGRAIGDLYTTWPLLLGSVLIALFFAFVYNWLSETIAGVLVGFAILVIIVGGFLASYTLVKAGREAADSDAASNRSKAMYGIGYSIAIVTLIFVLVVIAMRKRIRIAIEVIKEANRCVHDIWALIVYPLIPMFCGVGYIVFWVVVAVYIFAVWVLKDEVFPRYITENSQFKSQILVPGSEWAKTWNGTHYIYQSYTWDQSMQNSFAFIFFHLLWTVQFIIYFAYMVMAGTVANWCKNT